MLKQQASELTFGCYCNHKERNQIKTVKEMTPEEFEKMVKDYAENGLPEGSALIYLHGGENNFGTICGIGSHVVVTIAMNMFADRKFARLVRFACDFYDAEGGSEKAEAVDRIVKDFLRNNGFKMEGE